MGRMQGVKSALCILPLCCMVPEGVYAGGTIFIREKATITAHQWP